MLKRTPTIFNSQTREFFWVIRTLLSTINHMGYLIKKIFTDKSRSVSKNNFSELSAYLSTVRFAAEPTETSTKTEPSAKPEGEENENPEIETKVQEQTQPLTRDDLLEKLKSLMISCSKKDEDDDDDDNGSDFDDIDSTEDDDD